MPTTREYLEVLKAARGTAIVVTTMTASKVWPLLNDGPLDVNYLPSAMGHAADIALGIALGAPSRRVVCVNGDGSLAMNLGGLITAAEQRVENLTQILLVNHRYAIVGGPPIPGAGRVDWSGMARAAGWRLVRSYQEVAPFAADISELLTAQGPIFAALEVVDPPELAQRLPPRHPGQALHDLHAELTRDQS
jgi:phosphonopyruvate decarboxylase